MPEVEFDFSRLYILDPIQNFVIHVQLERYQERIEIIENVRVFTEGFVGGFVHERHLIIIRPPDSDAFDLN